MCGIIEKNVKGAIKVKNASKVTESLVCGTCTHCNVKTCGHRKQCYCSLTGKRVMSYYPFCNDYEWCGYDALDPVPVKVMDTGYSYLVA